MLSEGEGTSRTLCEQFLAVGKRQRNTAEVESAFSFLEAATNFHEPGVLKQEKFILSEFWRPGVQIRESAGAHSLWRLGGEQASPLPAPAGTGMPFFVAAYPQPLPSFSCHLLLRMSTSNLPPPLSYKIACDCI